MAERSETAVGATTGRPRAGEGQTKRVSEATAQLSVDALAAELDAEPDTPADAPATAAAASAADTSAPTDPKDAPTDDATDEQAGKSAGESAGPKADEPADEDAEPADSEPEPADAAEPEPDDATMALTAPADATPGRAASGAGAEPTAKAGAKTAATSTPQPQDARDTVDAASVPAPVRHSGDKIARRYRLEECTTSNEFFSSWRAVDEKLRRAVGLHLLAAAHPRAASVLAAARQAALLGDPRFVQVLDAVEDGDIVYVVREWLPDATGLDTLLIDEPLEAYEAYQLVRQLADALTAAHRRGLAHLRLTPACVLRTDSGQYRIDGIAVNAALRGIEAADKADAALQDTRAIGALLFAALTHRWPFAEGGNGLQRLPRALGVVPAEQVRAGVHRGLSDLTARTLCTPPGGRLTPIVAPDELAKAVAELPKVRQPEPEPLVLPSYPTHRASGHHGPTRQDSARHASATAPTTVTPAVPPRRPQQAPQAPQPALPGRSGRALKWAVSLVVLGAIALGSWGTAEALMTPDNTNRTTTQLSQGGSAPKPGNPTTNDGRTLKTLTLTSAVEFSPLDPTTIAGDKASLAIDNNPATAWITKGYDGYPNFGNLSNRKDGSGILVDLGSVQSVSEVKVLLPFGGQTQEILAAPADATGAPTGLSGFTQRISNDQLLAGTSLDSGVLAKPVLTRYVLIHVTSLPADPSNPGKYRGGIAEIQVLG